MSDTRYLVKIDGVLRETELAWLIYVDGNEIWIPMLSGRDDSCEMDYEELEIEMPEWLMIEKHLEDYGDEK